MIERRKLENRAPTGDLPGRIDRLQERLGEVPCLDAVFEEETVRIDDLRILGESGRQGLGIALVVFADEIRVDGADRLLVLG